MKGYRWIGLLLFIGVAKILGVAAVRLPGPPRRRPYPPEGQTMWSEDAKPGDLQFLEEQVNEYNFATTGIRDARLLVLLLRDSADHIVAGLSGHSWGGVCEVRFLWVHASQRHMGVGSRLLRTAEEEARAPGFYQKHGYVVAGQFLDYPRGHLSIFLEKVL